MVRWNEGLFRPWERPVLAFLSAWLPPWVTPDLLTATGVFGALLSAVAYGLAGAHPALLWLATLGLAINWFGDSLDGTVARLRKIERPRYGYYLDNALDCLVALPVAIGLGLSGYLRLDVCLLSLSIYTMISALTFLRANVTEVFQISYSGIGPTEMRAAMLALNTLIFIHPPAAFAVAGVWLKYPDLIALVWCASAIVSFVVCLTLQARELAVEEPTPRNEATLREAAVRALVVQSKAAVVPEFASQQSNPH